MKRNATVREATRDRQPLGALSARLCLERSSGVSLLLVLRPPLVAPYCDVIWHVTRGRAHARLLARRVSRERSAAPHRALYTLYTHLVHALCAPVIFINRRVTTTLPLPLLLLVQPSLPPPLRLAGTISSLHRRILLGRI